MLLNGIVHTTAGPANVTSLAAGSAVSKTWVPELVLPFVLVLTWSKFGRSVLFCSLYKA